MVDCEMCRFVSVCKKRPKMPGAKIAECNTFRERLNKEKPMTNADRIRAMTDEELAQLLYCSDSLGWCRNLPECGELLDTDEGIPEVKCIGCLLSWLQQPAE